MAVGDITNLGTPFEGNSGTSQAYNVGTVPAAPPNAGIIVGVSCGDNGNVNNASCTDDRGNTYTRIKRENASGLTELNFFYCIGATALQNNDDITISGISDARARVIGAAYVEGMGSLFGSNSATGAGTTPASGTVASMPTDTIVIGILGWSNQPETGVFTTATQDADYSSGIAGKNSNLGGAVGSDRAVFFGNRVISGGPVTDGYSPTLSGSSIWNAIIAAFEPATGVTVGVTGVGATGGVGTAVVPGSDQTVSVTGVSAAAGVGAAAAGAQIFLDDGFERSSVNIAGSSVVGLGDDTVITIKPRVQESEAWPPSGGTRWLFPYFRISGAKGIRPTFVITDYGSGEGKYHGHPWPSGRRMMFTYDPDDSAAWEHFDTNHTIGSTTITFRHSTAFTEVEVYGAWSRAVSVTQIGNWIEGLATSHAALVTTLPATLGAGNVPAAIQSFPAQDYISAMFSAQTDELSRTIPETPFYALGLDDTALTPTDGCEKRHFDLHSEMHAGEDLGWFVLARGLNWLLSADAAAVNLRRHFRFNVYPCHNAPGKYGGGHRGSFDQGVNGEDDANRHFSETDTGLEIIDIPKAVFVTDWAGTTRHVNLSFHGNFAFQREIYTPDQSGDDFYAAVDVYENGINDNTNVVTGSYGYWVRNSFDYYLATTVETGEPAPLTEAALTQWAESIFKAVNDLLVAGKIPGDGLGAPVGVAATASIGAVSIDIQESVAATGVASAGAVGDAGVVVAATVAAAGVQAAGAIGDVGVAADMTVAATGVAAGGAVGAVAVVGEGDALAEPAGVSASAALGTADVVIDGGTLLDGVGAAGAIGSAAVAVSDTVAVSGVSAGGAIAAAVVSSAGDALAELAGIGVVGSVGNVGVLFDVTVAVTGVGGAGAVGSATIAPPVRLPPLELASRAPRRSFTSRQH